MKQCEYDGCSESPQVGFRRCRAHLKAYTTAEWDESKGRMLSELGWPEDTEAP